MKTYHALTFILLVCGALAANYTPISSETINNSQLIQDLRQLGAQYTLEKAIYVKSPSVPNGYWNIEETESAGTRTANGVTYYQFIVKIRCESDPFLIRARYVVAFNPSNGNTVVNPLAENISSQISN